MRWPGFRKVRGQVCTRLAKRINELGYSGPAAYRAYLEATPSEWARLDSMCRITVSRFYRDKLVWQRLGEDILPELAESARHRGEEALRCWRAGCASGEEPYTLSLLWHFLPASQVLPLTIIATDSNAHLLKRAEAACYPFSSVKALPNEWRSTAFKHKDEIYWLRNRYRQGVRFICQDLRATMPDGPFHVVFCRNLAFTYFDTDLQARILRQLYQRIHPGSYLVLGAHERLPVNTFALTRISQHFPLFRANGTFGATNKSR